MTKRDEIMHKRKIFLLVSVIIILGAGLRLHDLAEESLWTDEIISLTHVTKATFSSIITDVIEIELTPAGYFLLLWKWVDLFGDSEFSIRLLSTLFDLGSIILIFFLGKKLFNTKIGLLSAFFLATTMLQIVYAQEARPFALFGFLVLLSSLLLLQFCHNAKEPTPRKWYFAAYTLVTALTLYVGYMAVFLIVLHFFWIYVKNRHIAKEYLLSIAIVIILFIPGIRILYIQALLRHPLLQEGFLLRGIPAFLANLGVLFWIFPLTLLLIIAILCFFILKNIRISNNKIICGTLTLLLFAGIGHLCILPTTLRSFSFIRHSFFIVLFVYIVSAKVITMVNSRKSTIAIMLIIILFNSLTLHVYYDKTTKAPWEEAVSHIQDNSPPGTLVLFDRSGSNLRLFTYYQEKSYDEENRPLGSEFSHINLTWMENRKFRTIDEKKLFRTVEQENSFWLISSRNIKTTDYYRELLNDQYRLISAQQYPELALYYYAVR